MSLRYHEIAEADRRVLNPFSEDKVRLLGQLCRLQKGWRHLDLACGKGEMLSTWADRYGTLGLGIDLSEVFVSDARRRAAALDITDRVEFRQGDAQDPDVEAHAYDVVSCIGATWIGGGIPGTVKILKRGLRPGGLMLVGDVYWKDAPDEPTARAFQTPLDEWVTLDGTLTRFEQGGMEVVEFVLADDECWDRYSGAQWWALTSWLAAHPEDPDAAAFAKELTEDRHRYFAHARRNLGWGVFVLRER